MIFHRASKLPRGLSAYSSSRFDLEVVQDMQAKVKEWFPEFLKNKSLMSREVYKEALKLIDIPVTEENFDEYKAAWQTIVDNAPNGI